MLQSRPRNFGSRRSRYSTNRTVRTWILLSLDNDGGSLETFSMIRLNQEDRGMNNNYEAAEVIAIGNARDTILGIKEWDVMDNRVDVDMSHRDNPCAMFDE